MNVNLIFFLLIIFLSKKNCLDSPLSESIIAIKLLSNNISIINSSAEFYYDNKIIYNIDVIISTYMNYSIINASLIPLEFETLSFGNTIKYLYLEYQEENTKENLPEITLHKDNIFFKIVNISQISISQDIKTILSLNDIKEELILFDYINKKIIIDNYDEFLYNNLISEEENYTLDERNMCSNMSLDTDNNQKFVCKLDYILFGHEDLPKDDVYLAKQIDLKLSTAYFDNMLSYSIFPYEYFDYFFTSFFSELNDGCTKHSYSFYLNEKEHKKFYYIKCPKKKIDIYTKRRKLSLIINKFSYRIENLFVDSFDFLNSEDTETDLYYFNILFEEGRNNFILGMGFLSKLIFANLDKCTYIFSRERIDYTEDLTDDSSENFEKLLYILTGSSFTFLLLIFTIIGYIHSKKINSELKEMLRTD